MSRYISHALVIICVILLTYECRNAEAYPGLGSGLNKLRHGIFPGTLWCGKGNIAKSDNDLGRLWEEDTCCRAHDRCPMKIKSHTSKYGLENKHSFTRLHCSCDEQFHRCLKSVNSKTARSIGTIFFSVLKPKCFETFTNKHECEERNLRINPAESGVLCASWRVNPTW